MELNVSKETTGLVHVNNKIMASCQTKHACLPSIKPNITKNEIELWKTLLGFERPQFTSLWIVFKSVHPGLINVLRDFFTFHWIWWQFPLLEFWKISWHMSFNIFFHAPKPCTDKIECIKVAISITILSSSSVLSSLSLRSCNNISNKTEAQLHNNRIETTSACIAWRPRSAFTCKFGL